MFKVNRFRRHQDLFVCTVSDESAEHAASISRLQGRLDGQFFVQIPISQLNRFNLSFRKVCLPLN